MKACLILNPAAGPRDFHRQVDQAAEYLRAQGWEVESLHTAERGDATRLAHQAADAGYDVAVAVGGDGTVNEVVNGLAGSQTALGVIPAGTANVYAVDVGIPLWNPLHPDAVQAAAEIIHAGQRRQIDLGRVQLGDGRQRYFLMWCGVGLDAAISKEIRSEDTRRLGAMAWVIAAAMVAASFMGTPGTVTIGGRSGRRRVLWALANNGQLYGLLWRVAPDAKLDDGLLDLAIFEGYGVLSTIRHFAALTLRQIVRDPTFRLYRGRSITIKTRKPLPVHVDAEPIGTTPVRIEVVPRCLSVVLPEHLPDHLFSER